MVISASSCRGNRNEMKVQKMKYKRKKKKEKRQAGIEEDKHVCLQGTAKNCRAVHPRLDGIVG
jgi:hypothetical protein